jgi:hypothetical protein
MRAARGSGAIKHTLHPTRDQAFLTDHGTQSSVIALDTRIVARELQFLHENT